MATITFSQTVSKFAAGYEKVIGAVKSYLTGTANLSLSSALGFYTHNGTSLTQQMTIDAAGRVGIATASPAAKLHVYDSPASVANSFILQNNSSAASSGFRMTFMSNTVDASAITSQVQATTADSDLYFSTRGTSVLTERMRILANGNVGVGTATPGYKLDVSGTLNVSGATTNVSDERFKKNITVIPNALEKLLSLNGVLYNYRTEEFPERNFTDRRVMGVIAQKVEKVFPEAVSRDTKGYRSVAYSMLIAPIIEAIRGLDKRITDLFKASENQSRAIANLQMENEARTKKLPNSKKTMPKLKIV